MASCRRALAFTSVLVLTILKLSLAQTTIADDTGGGGGTSPARTGDGTCVWYGVCNVAGSPSLQTSQYCPYNGTARPVDDRTRDLLQVWCKHLLVDDAVTCCDAQQVDVLNQNVKLAANFLARCPSCMANLVRHMCDFTCSPQQSKFMEIKATEVNDKTKKRIHHKHRPAHHRSVHERNVRLVQCGVESVDGTARA
uniref:Niemann-Pick C1 protein n=1 Tax=Culex pipiens TaxID=7175 RepID=A0A8D8NX36_CULPI